MSDNIKSSIYLITLVPDVASMFNVVNIRTCLENKKNYSINSDQCFIIRIYFKYLSTSQSYFWYLSTEKFRYFKTFVTQVTNPESAFLSLSLPLDRLPTCCSRVQISCFYITKWWSVPRDLVVQSCVAVWVTSRELPRHLRELVYFCDSSAWETWWGRR